MIKLQTAEDMKLISIKKYEVFQKESIESPAFKRMVQAIEEAALNGQIKVIFKFYEEEDFGMMVVFLKLLRNAGYKVDVLLGNKLSIKWH